MKEATRQLVRNDLAVKVSFGGEKRGCLGEVLGIERYKDEVGVDWDVTESEGSYPSFLAGNDKQAKKKKIKKFIIRETDLQILKATADFLKAQLIEAVEECYIEELNEGDIIEYDNCYVFEILLHINDKYAKMDAHILKANKKIFMEDPDSDDPVNNYFTRQEKCQHIAKTSKSPISDEDMFTQLVEHMGKTGFFSRSTLKFGKHLDENKTWLKAKKMVPQGSRQYRGDGEVLGRRQIIVGERGGTQQ